MGWGGVLGRPHRSRPTRTQRIHMSMLLQASHHLLRLQQLLLVEQEEGAANYGTLANAEEQPDVRL